MIGNVKSSIHGSYHAINDRHFPHCLAEFLSFQSAIQARRRDALAWPCGGANSAYAKWVAQAC